MRNDKIDKLCRFTLRSCPEENRSRFGPCEWETEDPEPVEDWELQHLFIEV